jgi:acyl-CoA thioester hydrolase
MGQELANGTDPTYVDSPAPHSTVPGEVVVAVPLRWDDLGTDGRLDDVAHFRLIEQARAMVFAGIDDGPPLFERGMVVVRQSLKYLRPLRYGLKPVLVGLLIEHVGRSSFALSCRIFDTSGDGERVFAFGTVVMVAYDPGKATSRELDPNERAWLTAAKMS